MDLSAAQWRKSLVSGDDGGQCVQVATNLPGIVAVRDSKDPAGPVLVLTAGEWAWFLGAIRSGIFDI
ncbi:DUF397 domain-containing protein [Thermopolyspora sp. NPDC052614]|uniref:DUF397 domain-containing protein n=1 Tax=Thermopolyspora sp. NPDC052614 TaxID=3155682 RepID=UPI0034170D8C